MSLVCLLIFIFADVFAYSFFFLRPGGVISKPAVPARGQGRANVLHPAEDRGEGGGSGFSSPLLKDDNWSKDG